jgi:Trk-type K+ transport system membrane component
MMPAALKVIYIFQMWLGRLEFTALLVLIGYALVLIRGK